MNIDDEDMGAGDATVKNPNECITYPITDRSVGYMQRLDEDARAIRQQFQADEAMRARSFDPRRTELLQIFDSLNDEGKDKALALLKGLIS